MFLSMHNTLFNIMYIVKNALKGINSAFPKYVFNNNLFV